MKIIMNWMAQGSPDGHIVKRYEKDEIYDAPHTLACTLINNGSAKKYYTPEEIVQQMCDDLDRTNEYLRYLRSVKYPQVSMTLQEWDNWRFGLVKRHG